MGNKKNEEKKASEAIESKDNLAPTTEEVKGIEVNEEVDLSQSQENQEAGVELKAEKGAVPVPEDEEKPKYDLSVLKKADNVRTLIDYVNGRIGDQKVIEILDKVTGK